MRNRLREAGLRACRTARVPELTRRRRDCLNYSRAHVNRRINLWRTVLFTDVSRFSLFWNDGRMRVWRHQGQRFHADCVQPCLAFNGGSVMVWGGISWNTPTDLVVIAPPPLNARRYVDEILRPHVIPQHHILGQRFLLMQDNVRPHTARITHHFLEEKWH